jgi:hypothetical protein
MKKRRIRSIIACIAIIALTIACTERKFEKIGWTSKTDPNFPPSEREAMLNDLLTSHKLVGLKYTDVIALLGVPDEVDSSLMSYEIEIDYGSDIDPIYTKDLYLFITRDSLIRSYEIKEWKKE